jgi:hypothetical protein
MTTALIEHGVQTKGDLPGHPFRGNQWEGGQGGSFANHDIYDPSSEPYTHATRSQHVESILKEGLRKSDGIYGKAIYLGVGENSVNTGRQFADTLLHVRMKEGSRAVVASGMRDFYKIAEAAGAPDDANDPSPYFVKAGIDAVRVKKPDGDFMVVFNQDSIAKISVEPIKSRLSILHKTLEIATAAVRLKQMLLKDQLRNAVVKAVHVKQYEETEKELAEAVAELIKRQWADAGMKLGRTKDEVELIEKGDLPGHPFRGNQWSGGGRVSISVETLDKDSAKSLTENVTAWEGERGKIAGYAVAEVSEYGFQGIVGKEAGEVVGVASFDLKQNPPVMVVNNLATKRGGFGVQMMTNLCKKAVESGVGMRLAAIEDAVPFYKAIGMHPIGTRNIFVFTREDCESFYNENKILLKSVILEPKNGVFVSSAGNEKSPSFLSTKSPSVQDIFNPRDWDDELVDTCLPILMRKAGEAAAAQMLIMGVDVAPRKKVGRTEKGDLPGHPFRGNQWGGGQGSIEVGSFPSIKEIHADLTGRGDGKEHSILVDSSGKVVGKISGDPEGVDIPDNPRNNDPSARMELHHNHPYDMPPSQGDLLMFEAHPGVAVGYAHTPSEIHRFEALTDDRRGLYLAAQKAYTDAKYAELDKIDFEGMTSEQRAAAKKQVYRASHETALKQLVSEGWIRYDRMPAPSQKSPSFTSTKTTATDWLLDNADAEDLRFLWPEVFTLPSGAVIDMGFATEWPAWMKAEISNQMKECFEQPFWKGIKVDQGDSRRDGRRRARRILPQQGDQHR